jgi:chromosome segregation ATPase
MSYRNYQPSQLPAELMFRDAQIEMQVAQIDRLENRIKELEADNKNANAESDENHELIMEQSTCIKDLTDKLDAVEDKFRGIEARKKALKKDVDEMYEMYEMANEMIADRDGRIATLTMG